MDSLRQLLLVALLAFVIASAVTAIHVATHAQMLVPTYDPTSLDVSSMSDAELCALEHERLTGLAAIRAVGASGIASMFGPSWLMLFLAVGLGCFLYARLSERRPRPAHT